METISCKVCNCKNFKKIFDQDYPLKKYDGTIEKVVIEDVICKKCGLVYRNPMPSLKELIDYYSHKSSSNNSYKFEGNLFDFRYYNHAITQTEVSQIYNGLSTFGGEVLHLPLNDRST